jgi:hypothetical protein
MRAVIELFGRQVATVAMHAAMSEEGRLDLPSKQVEGLPRPVHTA